MANLETTTADAGRHRPRIDRPAAWALLGCVVALGGCGSGDSQPAEYPSRPIKLIVPFAAGGGTDNFARIIKRAIEEEGYLEQPLVIINIDGAGATIGSRRAKNAKPDGYTMLILHDAILTAEASGTVNFGPESFEAIAGTGEVGLVVAVNEDSPYENLEQLMDDCRKRPDEVVFAANMGAITHYAGLQLEAASDSLHPNKSPAKFRFVQVGGGVHRYSALTGGHVHVTGFSIEEFVRFRADGIRGLAYLGDAPHPAAPNMPTATGEGYRVTNSNVFYWWFPKGTDPQKVAKIADVLRRVMKSQVVKEKMDEIQCEPIYLRDAALQDRLKTAARQYENVAPRQEVRLPNFPVIVLGFTGALVVMVLLQSWYSGQGLLSAPTAQWKTAGFAPRRMLAAVCIALTFVYVLALSVAPLVAELLGIDRGWVGFRPATLLYVLALGLTLTRMNYRRLPDVLFMASILAFGLHDLFTQQFSVDLP